MISQWLQSNLSFVQLVNADLPADIPSCAGGFLRAGQKTVRPAAVNLNLSALWSSNIPRGMPLLQGFASAGLTFMASMRPKLPFCSFSGGLLAGMIAAGNKTQPKK
jgi:hypothetical protein